MAHSAWRCDFGIDWNAAYGINALKDFCVLGEKMTTATFKTKAERDAHLGEYREADRLDGEALEHRRSKRGD